MSEHVITTPDGAALHSVMTGPEAAPVVVFCNSVMTDLHIWDAQATALEGRYRVLRYDQRGHGKSGLPDGPMQFDTYGADLLAVLQGHGVERCLCVGLSMGVPTALAAIVQDPARFAGLVAVDGMAQSAGARAAFWTERRETAQSAGMGTIAEQTVPRWLPGTDADSAPDSPTAQRLAAMIAATPVAGFAAATHALERYDQRGALGALRGPFLGIVGALDGAMPAGMRSQFDPLADARFVEIPDAGHVPNFQAPEAFNAALLGFVDATLSSSSTPSPIEERL